VSLCDFFVRRFSFMRWASCTPTHALGNTVPRHPTRRLFGILGSTEDVYVRKHRTSLGAMGLWYVRLVKGAASEESTRAMHSLHCPPYKNGWLKSSRGLCPHQSPSCRVQFIRRFTPTQQSMTWCRGTMTHCPLLRRKTGRILNEAFVYDVGVLRPEALDWYGYRTR
jgi:hypothetical protein